MQRATNRVLSYRGVAGQLTATAEWSDNCGAVLIIKTNLSAGLNACACHMRARAAQFVLVYASISAGGLE